MKHDNENLQIAIALLNSFHKPVVSDKLDFDVAEVMISRKNIPNRLKKVMGDYKLNKMRAPFLQLEFTNLDNEENHKNLEFPQLSLKVSGLINYYYAIISDFLLCRTYQRRKFSSSKI